jgi:deoxyribodipyrimidine photo-lyase
MKEKSRGSRNSSGREVAKLMQQFLGASFRQYSFMIKGLSAGEQNLAAKNIPFHLLCGSPEVEIPEFISLKKARNLL